MAKILKFNAFKKSGKSKTGFTIHDGEAIFSSSVYLIHPTYIHKRSPAFSLVDNRGRHVSGFFRCGGGAFIGDFQKKALIVFTRENGFDLFSTDLDPVTCRELLVTGELNDQLFIAREQAKKVTQ